MGKRIWWTEIKFATVDMTLHYNSTEQKFRFPSKRCFLWRFFGLDGILFYRKTPKENTNLCPRLNRPPGYTGLKISSCSMCDAPRPCKYQKRRK